MVLIKYTVSAPDGVINKPQTNKQTNDEQIMNYAFTGLERFHKTMTSYVQQICSQPRNESEPVHTSYCERATGNSANPYVVTRPTHHLFKAYVGV